MLDNLSLNPSLCLKCESPASDRQKEKFCMLIECVSGREEASLHVVDDRDGCRWTTTEAGKQKSELKWGENGGGWGMSTQFNLVEYNKIIQHFRPALPQASHACSVRTQETRKHWFPLSLSSLRVSPPKTKYDSNSWKRSNMESLKANQT